MSRRVCLSIGVGNVTSRRGQASRFAYLDGAPVAAEAIGQWALSSGFGTDNVRIVTDRASPNGAANPVTSARVQAAVDALFPDGVQTDHLILSFCGHGLTADVGSTFWLFSDALEQQYRVHVDSFTYEVLTFGINRISLISDACRDAPKDLDLMRLESRRAIVGRQEQSDSPMFDRLAACQDGQKAYMVGDPTAASLGKCILTGVVLDVLWGNEPAAFKNNVIDTHSFGIFTRDRATQRAAEYGLKLHPQCTVDPQAVLLVDGAAKPAPTIELPPWPPTARAEPMGPADDSIRRGGLRTRSFELLRADKTFRDAMLGEDFGTSHPHLETSGRFTGLPEDARLLVERLFTLRQLQSTASARVEADISSTISVLEGKAASHARAAAANVLCIALSHVHLPHKAEEPNLIVTGSGVRAIWSDLRVTRGDAAGGETQFRITPWSAVHGTQVVVEFDDGAFVPVYLYPRLFGIVVREPGGTAAIAYAARSDFEGHVLAQSAIAIDELTRGVLDSTQIETLAARMRDGKHANPIIGAVAAYLYRQISDFDNLRRMAYYYVHHEQPIPFDIALLGQMDVYAEKGTYFARVPAVTRSEREPGRNPLPAYVSSDTPAVTGPLAGRCPWLTLGWDYPPGDQFGDTFYREYGARGIFRPSSFTSLVREFGALLSGAWNLKPWE